MLNVQKNGARLTVKGISLRCVECGVGGLGLDEAGIRCDFCGVDYPFAGGCPVLLKRNTIFSRGSVGEAGGAGMSTGGVFRLRQLLPGPSFTYFAAKAKRDAIGQHSGKTKHCLLIGAGENQAEVATLSDAFGTVLVTDVARRDGIDIVCDGHDLPFPDDTFDFVMLTAVLEHVLSPERVTAEVVRVLKKGGVVYAVTPFMQQVHMGAYDFHRFTDLGHRWLFRSFEELDRGTCGGPASTLVWSFMYFSSSLSPIPAVSRLFSIGTRICLFWLKYLDFFLEKRLTARDGANGFYFVGRNAKQEVLTPEELLRLYVGAPR